MAQLGTRLLPVVGTTDPWDIVKVGPGEGPKRIIIEVIQSPGSQGKCFVSFSASELQANLDPSNIVTGAYRIGDGCSQSFKVEAGQTLYVAGTATTYVSYHIYKSVGDEEAGC